jgi:hypothetical protein
MGGSLAAQFRLYFGLDIYDDRHRCRLLFTVALAAV